MLNACYRAAQADARISSLQSEYKRSPSKTITLCINIDDSSDRDHVAKSRAKDGGVVGVRQVLDHGVTSNEPINGPGDGNTNYDWRITGPLTVELRAERAGPLIGRVYTLAVRCADAVGNASTTTVTVSVPHDQRGK